MKQVIVGTYDIGSERVELFLRQGDGGEFNAMPDRSGIAQIKIGADFPTWHDVVATLLHEALEFQMMQRGNRYSPAPDHAQDHSSYLFVMTHQQFSEVTARAGIFVAHCLPDLARAWNRWRKKK